MNEIVVDTNVWITAGKLAKEVSTIEEADCIEACLDWSNEFLAGDAKVLIDSQGKVLDEYGTYIATWCFPGSKLFELYNHIWGRFEAVDVNFDDDGYALLPESISFHDAADRKWIALAIAITPFALIYNAADTDWAKEREQLAQHGLTIHELCPEYIKESMR